MEINILIIGFAWNTFHSPPCLSAIGEGLSDVVEISVKRGAVFMEQTNKGTILAVDDDPFVLSATSELLISRGYTVTALNDPREAVKKLQTTSFDIILSDIMMPKLNGIELLKIIHKNYPDTPVILMTAFAELDTAVNAIREGAFDFIIKPYKAEYLFFTIEKAIRFKKIIELEKNYKTLLEELVRERTKKLADALTSLKESSLEMVNRLTVVAEYRDTETGAHISRMGFYAQKIAGVLKMPASLIETIGQPAMMHDIGKIAIPDKILLKQGPLTKEEFEVIKTHTTIGYNMLAGSVHKNIQMAANIALNHHEKYDGLGYPRGLKGKEIPIEGMIVMICDVYDALMSKRPYKRAFSHDEAFKIITEGDGRTRPEDFDPVVLKAFKEAAPALEDIFHKNQELKPSI